MVFLSTSAWLLHFRVFFLYHLCVVSSTHSCMGLFHTQILDFLPKSQNSYPSIFPIFLAPNPRIHTHSLLPSLASLIKEATFLHLSGSGWKFLYSGYLPFVGLGCWALLVPWSLQQLPFVGLSLFTGGSSVSSVGPLDEVGIDFLPIGFLVTIADWCGCLMPPGVYVGWFFRQVRFFQIWCDLARGGYPK